MIAGDRTPAKRNAAPPGLLERLLEFRPWMLALAVFLACAIGVAIMEHARDVGPMWAQVSSSDSGSHGR